MYFCLAVAGVNDMKDKALHGQCKNVHVNASRILSTAHVGEGGDLEKRKRKTVAPASLKSVDNTFLISPFF